MKLYALTTLINGDKETTLHRSSDLAKKELFNFVITQWGLEWPEDDPTMMGYVPIPNSADDAIDAYFNAVGGTWTIDEYTLRDADFACGGLVEDQDGILHCPHCCEGEMLPDGSFRSPSEEEMAR